MYSLVHATGFALDSGFGMTVFPSLHSLSPQTLDEVFAPNDFAPCDCGEPFAFAASADSNILNEVRNTADNKMLIVNSVENVLVIDL
jgi:hypothetical protein